jgi:hypothetical protein
LRAECTFIDCRLESTSRRGSSLLFGESTHHRVNKEPGTHRRALLFPLPLAE